MYKIKDIVYADAGFILLGSNKKGYQFEGKCCDFKEKKISLRDIQINGKFVYYDGIIQMLPNTLDYSTLKADMVKKRYSVDDQIAIILNADNSEEDRLRYTKMQEWRDWSAKVAKAIMQSF